jgi:hypothetical protein
MANEIISYHEMCRRESSSLQRGMNFRLGGARSVILMSVRINAPYRDELQDNGTVLIYEGHDVPRRIGGPDPKNVDQPERYPNGSLTENGRFHQAATDYKAGRSGPHLVRVYEKIRDGIWSYNGLFHLVDAWQEQDHQRKVFKFRLVAVESEMPLPDLEFYEAERRRIIPTAVKLEVWKRDKGRCQVCGASNELHFDHDLPFSKGGTSMKADNVRLLCARHNLSKGDKIQ